MARQVVADDARLRPALRAHHRDRFLTSAHLNRTTTCCSVPAAAIAYRTLREGPKGGRDGSLLAVATFVVLLANGISANAIERPPIRVPVAAMALFAIGLAWRLRGLSSPTATSAATVPVAEAG